jgi:hypothetical protein
VRISCFSLLRGEVSVFNWLSALSLRAEKVCYCSGNLSGHIFHGCPPLMPPKSLPVLLPPLLLHKQPQLQQRQQ